MVLVATGALLLVNNSEPLWWLYFSAAISFIVSRVFCSASGWEGAMQASDYNVHHLDSCGRRRPV